MRTYFGMWPIIAIFVIAFAVFAWVIRGTFIKSNNGGNDGQEGDSSSPTNDDEA